MDDLDLGFCAQCCDQILSRRLSIFWKCVCASTITDKQWVAFQNDDRLATKYIKALEVKGFLVSTDYEDKILLKPHGVFQREDNSYLVCTCPSEHFANLEI